MSERHRLLLLAAAGKEDLRAQLAVDDELLIGRDDVVSPPAGGPWRLAIVDPDARRIAQARRIAESDAPWRGRNDIWYSSSPLLGEGRGTIALIFPGVEQRFEPVVDDIAAHFRLPRPQAFAVDGSVLQRSISLLAVGRLLDAALREIGIAPAAVAGHSIGEWNAMMSAGMIAPSSMDRLIAGVDPSAFELPGCLFAALGCGVEVARETIAGLEGVVISHDNCPHQSIVCGDEGAIAAAIERFSRLGVLTQVLNFRSGFHSPLLAPYLENVEAVAQLPIEPGRVPVWSATTTSLFPSDERTVRALIIRHLLEPVRFRTLIENLYASGVRAFVQAGVGSVKGFVDDTLAGCEFLSVAASVDGQSGLRQLRRTAAALWTEGATLRVDRLAASDANRIVVRDSSRVVAELEALLADAVDAARTVTARFAELQTASRSRLERRSTHYTWTLRLDEMPYVLDHCLTRQAASWPVIADRHPVIPLTTAFELMRDVARRLVPEREPIALRKVEALRWLALDRPLELAVSASFDGDESVDVDLGGYARATVVVRERYPDAPLADTRPFVNERPSPATAPQLYADRWLFHGPRFQGVTEVGAFGDDGVRGKVRVLESPGALVDCAGQLMVFWIMAAMPVDRYALPGGVASVEFFGPRPRVDAPITATVRITSVTPRTVYADFELADEEGRVHARLCGFENRRFATDDVIWPVLCYPEINTIAQSDAGGWVCVTERWNDAASREMIARRYLGSAEREEERTRPPRGRRHWLMGRIAAKDAVRRHLWEQGAGPLFPAEVAILADEDGRPIVEGPGSSPVCVSIAHSGDLAVAIAGADPVGIDVELVAPRNAALDAFALTEPERGLLAEAEGPARAERFTRMWAAKEAVSKAEGTGLGGNPAAFVVTEFDGERLRVVCEETAREYVVETSTVSGPAQPDGTTSTSVVAWTHQRRIEVAGQRGERDTQLHA